MAAERTDIGILGGGAGAHRALAQVDLLEPGPRGGGVVVEQLALRDRKSDRPFHIT